MKNDGRTLTLLWVGLGPHLAWGWHFKPSQESHPKKRTDWGTNWWGLCSRLPSTLAKPVFSNVLETTEEKESRIWLTARLICSELSSPPAGVHSNFKPLEVCVMNEGRTSELTPSASWIHKPIVTANVQILNSISSFVLTCLLFHLACCRITY